MASISASVPPCLNGFRSFLEGIPAFHAQTSLVDGNMREDLHPLIENEQGRFRIWAANLGAHRTGKSSLDYRLRDASHIKTQVIKLLTDLRECLQDGTSIADGTVAAWDDDIPDEEGSDSLEEDSMAPSGLTELSQIVSEISEIVNCLFRLAVTIQNPAPHDRFKRSALTDTSHYETFDIAHVRSKFPSTNEYIIERLGKATTFRRQYFRYREYHHEKLAAGLAGGHPIGDEETLDSTIATSLPQHLKRPSTDVYDHLDEDNSNDSGLSQISWASSSSTETHGEEPRLPPMPDEAHNGPFECPFCYRMVSIETTKQWRNHIYADLRPYICIYPDCQLPYQESFQDRAQWIHHNQDRHWKSWSCPFGCKDNIKGRRELRSHITGNHKDVVDPQKTETLMALGEHQRPLDTPRRCELCHEEMGSFKLYSRHLARHQEVISLFVLPVRATDDYELSEDERPKVPRRVGVMYGYHVPKVSIDPLRMEMEKLAILPSEYDEIRTILGPVRLDVPAYIENWDQLRTWMGAAGISQKIQIQTYDMFVRKYGKEFVPDLPEEMSTMPELAGLQPLPIPWERLWRSGSGKWPGKGAADVENHASST